VSTPTAPPDPDLADLRRARLGRRLFMVALTVFLALGVLNVYGVRTREVSATAGDDRLTVRYASVSRPGLASPWSVELRRAGGFRSDTVTLSADAAYFDIFDENGVEPDPVESRNDGDRIVWTFLAPVGDTLTFSLDARIEPAVQLKRARGNVSVPGTEQPLSVGFSTFVMP